MHPVHFIAEKTTANYYKYSFFPLAIVQRNSCPVRWPEPIVVQTVSCHKSWENIFKLYFFLMCDYRNCRVLVTLFKTNVKFCLNIQIITALIWVLSLAFQYHIQNLAINLCDCRLENAKNEIMHLNLTSDAGSWARKFLELPKLDNWNYGHCYYIMACSRLKLVV